MPDVETYDSPVEGKDYVLQLRIKNGPLLRAMRSRGFKSALPLSVASGVAYSILLKYLALTFAPINKKGEWKPSALALAKTLRLPPDCLFPEQHLERVLVRNSGELEISKEEVVLLLDAPEQLDPEQELEREQLSGKLAELMHSLTPREERVLRQRFGFGKEKELTLVEAGEAAGGISGQRIRQIEAKALHKLRHPSRLVELAKCLPRAEEELKKHRAEKPQLHDGHGWEQYAEYEPDA